MPCFAKVALSWTCLLVLQCAFCPFVSLKSAPTQTEPRNSICQRKRTAAFKLNLTAAMIFPDYLLLIDDSLLVYQIPRTALDRTGAIHQFGDIPGVAIEAYWPSLHDNQAWHRVRPRYKSVYHRIDVPLPKRQHPNVLVYMQLFRNPTVKGLVLNLTDGSVLDSPLQSPNEPEITQQIVADSGEEGRMHTLSWNTGGRLLWWTCRQTGQGESGVAQGGHADATLVGDLFYLVHEKKPKERNVTLIRKGLLDFNSLAALLKKRPQYADWRLEMIDDWNVTQDYLPVGYLNYGNVYLFATERLLVFEASDLPSYQVLNTQEFSDGTVVLSSKLNSLSYNEALLCGEEDEERDKKRAVTRRRQAGEPSTMGSSGAWLVIYPLVVLVFILCCVFMCRSSKRTGGNTELRRILSQEMTLPHLRKVKKSGGQCKGKPVEVPEKAADLGVKLKMLSKGKLIQSKSQFASKLSLKSKAPKEAKGLPER